MSRAPGTNGFVARQQLEQAAFFDRTPEARARLHPSAPYRLTDRAANLAPHIREDALEYFADKVWHTHAAHGLSSQACCLNFLMPLARRPEVLKRLVAGVLGFTPDRIMPVEDRENWFVAFEWPGLANYLSEWPSEEVPPRGANVTCADAMVRFRGADGDETLLIEWKYTETYSGGLRNELRPGAQKRPNDTRTERYADRLFADQGPISPRHRLQLSDFFYEPFYQLVRQQMLAFRMERSREAGSSRVRVLHISPAANTALHRVNSPAFQKLGFSDAFEAFAGVLEPAADGAPRFIARSTEEVFGPLLEEMPDDPWARYLTDRYTFLSTARAAEPA